MNPLPAADLTPSFIKTFGFRLKPVEEMQTPLIRLHSLWNEKRGQRPFPAKDAITPREIKEHLAYAAILRVLDGGNDFEYRLAGEALNRAFGGSLHGRKVSELSNVSMFTDLDALMDAVFRPIVAEPRPIAVRFEFELPDHSTFWREALHLPLGDDDRAVDHILAASSEAIRAIG